MKRIITNLEKLAEPAETLEFITDETISTEEGKQILEELQKVFDSKTNVFALAAPQIGIKKRIFGIRFDDAVKYFINPIITKKSGLTVAPETCASMPGKEILIGRPDEITVVYYTENFKYEDNKLIGPAARVFDQMYQLLDGVTPDELGLVSDVETDGSLSELSEEEIKEATEIWKKFVKTKLAKAEESIKADDDTRKVYDHLRFTESVINGRTTVVKDQPEVKMNRAQRRAASKAINRANLNNFIRGKK